MSHINSAHTISSGLKLILNAGFEKEWADK